MKLKKCNILTNFKLIQLKSIELKINKYFKFNIS